MKFREKKPNDNIQFRSNTNCVIEKRGCPSPSNSPQSFDRRVMLLERAKARGRTRARARAGRHSGRHYANVTMNFTERVVQRDREDTPYDKESTAKNSKHISDIVVIDLRYFEPNFLFTRNRFSMPAGCRAHKLYRLKTAYHIVTNCHIGDLCNCEMFKRNYF